MNEYYEPNISVTDPIGTAFSRVKLILFQDFNPGKWFVIGFCSFLAGICEVFGNAVADAISQLSNRLGRFDNQNAPQRLEELKEFITNNLSSIIVFGTVIAIVLLILGVVFLWLSSRGRFLFLHSVAKNRAEIVTPWHEYSSHGNSLFLFRLAVMFLGLLCFGLLTAGIVFIAIVAARGDQDLTLMLVIITVVLLLVTPPLAIVFGVVGKFTKDFIVPIMYMRNCTCMDSWREFLALLSVNKGRFALYILFQVVIAMVIGMLGFAFACIAFCAFFCLFMLAAIPVIGILFMLLRQYIFAVILLPLGVFVRSYSLHYLAQYGADYDAFAQPEIAPPPEPGYYQPDVAGL